MELPDIVKDFSTVDLKGNEDKILRSNCQYKIVVLTRFRPFIIYNTFYNGDIYQENA
jgi:hypothetical protein